MNNSNDTHSDSSDNTNHQYNTRSKNIPINSSELVLPARSKKSNHYKITPTPAKLVKKINTEDVDTDKPNITSDIIPKETSPKKNAKSADKIYKVKIPISFDNLFSSILVDKLVDESNEYMRKKHKSSDLADILHIDDDDTDTLLTDDSEYVQIENLPDGVNYSIEEEEYVKGLDKEKQKEILDMENKLLSISKSHIPIRFKILMSNMNERTKINIINKIDHYYSLDVTDNEFHKLSNWVTTLEKIPFGVYKQLPITKDNTQQEIGNYLLNAKKLLDDAVYGHEVAKTQIVSYLAKEIANPNGTGSVLAIEGPPGIGKTTLIKEGVCKAMGRPFTFITLGGATDASTFYGHSYTYEGAVHGRIVDQLITSGCMNPVIFMDELDKISTADNGVELSNLLCHITDHSQNREFHDRYFAGIDFDLSKCIFIFSYNDSSLINPILLDRMIKIKLDGFDVKSKISVANNYLIPSLLKEYNLGTEDITFTNDAITTIINTYTNNEKGVRNLKRCINEIISKINILRYTGTNNVDGVQIVDFKIPDFSLPYTVNNDTLKYFLKIDSSSDHISLMYM